jgi:16S rRNA (guanine966-N2)-methyltransferase
MARACCRWRSHAQQRLTPASVPQLGAGRVIAGTARGIRLVAPREGTRPLGDRVKQTLFSVLEGGALGDWPVPFLDLFAGSGAAGIEALSRGSPRVVFVERDPTAVRTIRENLRRTKLEGEAQIEAVQSDVLRFLARAGDLAGHRAGESAVESAGESAGGSTRESNAVEAPFGAVLIDPPYGDAAMLPALERLGRPESRLVGKGSVVVAKHFWRDRLPPQIGALELQRERRFGETMLTFYQVVPER